MKKATNVALHHLTGKENQNEEDIHGYPVGYGDYG